MELAAVGNRLIARFGDLLCKITDIKDAPNGAGQIIGSEDIRDIEVINLDGLPEAEALRLLGVDERGNDVRGKTASASPSPNLPASAPATRFSPGQWVKLINTPEDLPAQLRKPGSGVKWEDEWIKPSTYTYISLNLTGGSPTPILRNVGVRARFLATVFVTSKGSPAAKLEVRASGKGNFQVAIDEDGRVSLRRYDRDSGKSSVIGDTFEVKPVQKQAEYVLELFAIGSVIQARLNGQLVSLAQDPAVSQASVNLSANCPVRDIEVINLDGLPEAEALRLLGVDEKGNDLRGKAGAAK